MKRMTSFLFATLILVGTFNLKAVCASRQPVFAPGLQASALSWNFIYAFGNGPVPGLSWSGNYLYITTGSYVVYSANGYAFLTPSTPVYCNAEDNANTYVQVFVSGSSNVSYYDFQSY
ncbi:hypothetical protein FHW36_110167 [Chitinophaga polysaccharea]|uniref:Uncharacterized protein n=1 Tax=Chitinophaga polysaccharea TaxID=1293035 RepID=A0A561PAA4_9BACT|nr:hypothetical protein [Chitinophaga polysaccharea]TWF34966.1 hypothetical protein FHW36_110167 [Chitinophaga polysaccharea]